MLYPSIDELLKQVDSKYTLAIASAKRARQIRDGNLPMVKSNSSKEVTVALEEIASGKIDYERMSNGIK